MMEDELGANWMLDVGYWLEVEVCAVVLTGCLNLRVSQSLMVSSPPRVTTNLPSALMSMPLVQVLGVCALLISPLGRVYGPSPPHIKIEPSRAAATRRLFPPSTWLPHVTAVIRLRPAEPASFDLWTMTSFCFIRILTSQIRNVLSVPAVTQRS